MRMKADNVKSQDPLSKKRQRRHSIYAGHRRALPRGQAMVEMALVLPIFLFFIFGIIEMGRAWSVKQVMTNAAREGARILILPYGPGYAYGTAEDVRVAAQQAVEDYLHFAGLSTAAGVTEIVLDGNINLNNAGPGGTTLRKAKVTVTHYFDTPLPVILLSGSSPIKMGVTSVMERE